MIIDFLNDALIFRAETNDERSAICKILEGISNHRLLDQTNASIEATSKYPSTGLSSLSLYSPFPFQK